MALTVDLSSHFALLGKLVSEISDKSVLKVTSAIDVDLSYVAHVPDTEPQRTQFLIQKAEETFHLIISRLRQPSKHTTLLIKKEVFIVLVGIVRDSPSRYHGHLLVENSLLQKWRPTLQGLAFDCLRVIVQLSAKSLVPSALDIITAAVRILQSRNDRKLEGMKEDYVRLSAKIFEFLTVVLSSPLIPDLLPSTTVRDLTECLLSDIWHPATSEMSQSATSCLILVLQTRAADLKADVKDRIFCGLVTSARAIIRIQQERHLVETESRSLHRILEALTVFVLCTAVHVGVLNVSAAVFRDGMTLNDTDVTIVCRMGLQILSSILRPRVPLDVLDSSVQMTEAATGRAANSAVFQELPKKNANELKPTKIQLTDDSLAVSIFSEPVLSEKIAVSSVNISGQAAVTSRPAGSASVPAEPMDTTELEKIQDESVGRSETERNVKRQKSSLVKESPDDVTSETLDLIASFRDIGTEDTESN